MSEVNANDTRATTVPTGVNWFLIGIITLLGLSMWYQFQQAVPMCKHILDRFGVPTTALLKLILELPPQLVLAVPLVVVTLAIVNRRSIRRLALLHILMVMMNLTLMTSLQMAFMKVTRAFPPPM